MVNGKTGERRGGWTSGHGPGTREKKTVTDFSLIIVNTHLTLQLTKPAIRRREEYNMYAAETVGYR